MNNPRNIYTIYDHHLIFASFFPLSQLLDTKSTDRKQTLLHFIVDIIKEKYPELQTFYTELHFLDKAALGMHTVIIFHIYILLYDRKSSIRGESDTQVAD